jgi:hypothetical protein
MSKETKVFEGFEYLKCVACGAETVEEVAAILEAQAAYIRELVKDGVQIDLDDIGSGHLRYLTEDPEIGAKYGFDSIEGNGKGHFVIRTPTGEILDEFDDAAE